MTQPMTTTQAMQQNNRDSAGKYATKEQTPAEGVSLEQSANDAYWAKLKPMHDDLAKIDAQQSQLRARKVQLMTELIAAEIHDAYPEAAWMVLERYDEDYTPTLRFFADADGSRVHVEEEQIENWDELDNHLTVLNWWDPREAGAAQFLDEAPEMDDIQEGLNVVVKLPSPRSR